MRLSQLFTKTSKTVPADETAKNAQLLIRAGYVYKEMAGVYAYLPLGLRVVENIKQIVREEMNMVGGQELIMTNLQRPELWQQTTRWDDEIVDIWFKTKLKDDTEIGLAWSHEEPIMQMMQQFVQSYKDLPTAVYQFQTKLRNELRAKSGVMRGREFVMKDMYSLHASAEDLDAYYNQVMEAYKRVFDRLGLGNDTYVTFASGGAFTKFSHEFQTICDAGEDVLYVHRGKNIAVNEEVLDEAVKELGINKDELEKVKSAEVGNIFNFGTDKSEALGIKFVNEKGEQQPIYLASYGIGITRLVGVIAEKLSDDKGLVWPEAVAPAKVYLARLGDSDEVVDQADELYDRLTESDVEVLYDDRDVRAGEKFADADLLGIPYRVVISDKTVASQQYEFKARKSDDSQLVGLAELLDKFGIAE
ncbi:MAG TPA: aminoacyl--tRNA ligase-related protein [Candidatus Saccharimonadales bacterium]|nr:aminoacyl--tRNA ligase-related protein [Candidatus Saccharimonadales bacterium]